MPHFKHHRGRAALLLALMLTIGAVPKASSQNAPAVIVTLPSGAAERSVASGASNPMVAVRPSEALTLDITTDGGRSHTGRALDAPAPWFSARGQQSDLDAPRISLQPEPQLGRTLTVSHNPNSQTVEEGRSAQRRHLVLAHGQVHGGLFDNLRTAGLPASLALNLIGTLSHELDLQRDVQPTDTFKILFERFRGLDGELLHNGQILHAELLISGRRLALWRHRSAAGAEWYDETGRSLRQTFLRTPLDGARVSSGFGHRLHPVLGFTRLHQGVDFAAPTGTPVFAAADGIVLSLGYAGGYGRLIRLRHGNGMTTSYAHLAAYAPTLRPGMRVAQGEVIGRVGASGHATGPHLHYEVAAAGRLVNPASLPVDAAHLAGPDLTAFQATRRSLLMSLARLQLMQEVAAAD